MKVLKLKNYLLINNANQGITSIQDWLMKQMLHGAESRNRTRFIKLLSERMAEIDKTIEDLKNKYIVKNDKGEILYEKDGKETTDPNGATMKFGSPEDMLTLNKDIGDYLNEDLIIDITPSVNEIVYGTRDLILKTNQEFSGIMATRYDEWCEAFENIKEEEKVSKKKKEV